MIVICEECGKKYRLDPEKIKGKKATFRCKNCNHLITVSKQEVDSAPPSPPPTPPTEPAFELGKRTISEEDLKKEKPPIEGMSIKSKITIIIVALVLVSLSVVGFIASMQSRKALSNQAEEHLLKTARQKSKEYRLTFERIRDEVLGIGDYVKATYDRKGLVEDLGTAVLMPWTGSGYGNDPLKNQMHNEILVLQRIGSVLKSVVSKNPYLSLGYFGTKTGMTVFDDEGTVKIIEKLKAFEVRKRPWYLQAKKEGKPIWTEPYIDANTKKLVVTCATPVYLTNTTLAGVVGFDVLLDTIQKDILTLDIGYNSYAFMVSRKGHVLVRPGMDPKDIRWDETYKTDNLLRTSNMAFNQIIGKMIKGQSEVNSYNAEGEDKYISFTPIPSIGASMAIVASRVKVIKPAMDIQKFIIVIWVVVLLVSILIGLIIGNNITKPINELTMMTNLISQGKVDLDVLAEDRKDEIGVLTKSFNRLVISLKVALSR